MMEWLYSANLNKKIREKISKTKIVNKLSFYLNLDDIVKIKLLQDCNMGGTYWRIFIWFNTDEDINRYFDIFSLWEDNIKPLVSWIDNEIITISNKSFKVLKQNNNYHWDLMPI